MSVSEIIFIDGPHAVGKDYFIENLVANYRSSDPSKRLVVLRATDFLTKAIKTNRYYATSEDLTADIISVFLGHISLLSHAKKLLNTGEADTVLINRSFASFIIYNLEDTYAHCSDGCVVPAYISTYVQLIKQLFKQSVFINLTVNDGTLEQRLDTILDRISSRNEDKAVDKAYLANLITGYDRLDEDFLSAFSFYEKLTSDKYQYVISKYMTPD